MTIASHNRCGRVRTLGCLLCLVLLAGCGPKSYKRDADERAYASIDRQWEPEFGSRTNYRITGAPPSPGDLDISAIERIEKSVSQTGVLTVPQAAAIALARNRDYHLQKELLYATALDLRLIRHSYEMQWFGGGTAYYLNDGTNERVVAEPNLGFNRLLATGARVGAAVGLRWVDVIRGMGDSGLSGVFAASAVQPLLRGSDPRIVREPLTQAERNVLYQIRSLARMRKSTIVSVVTLYHEALELRDVVQNADRYIESLEALETRVQDLVNAGRLSQEELPRVRQEILIARDARILAQKEYERWLDLLKITMGVPPTMDFDLNLEVFEAWRTRGIPYPDFSLDEAVEAALYRRLDLTNNADMVIDAQRAVYVAKDALRPGMNIFAETELQTDGDRAVVGGATVDLPLDRVAEQDQYARALVLLSQRMREYDLTADTVRMEVREAHRKLLEAAQRYQVLSEAVPLAQRRVESTFALLSYARVSSRRVLSALEQLHDARNETADALTDYAIATLEFYRDTEVLQIRPDGMWELGPEAPPIARTEARTRQ